MTASGERCARCHTWSGNEIHEPPFRHRILRVKGYVTGTAHAFVPPPGEGGGAGMSEDGDEALHDVEAALAKAEARLRAQEAELADLRAAKAAVGELDDEVREATDPRNRRTDVLGIRDCSMAPRRHRGEGGDVSDDWATPKWLLELLFPDGKFYDPCPLGPGSAGLESWPRDKHIFVNPPFSDPLPWVRKAAEHDGPVTLLLPVDATTKWWTYSDGFRVTIIGSRLHFSESKTYARGTFCIWRKWK